ncbi:uncharacterized protein KQ657_000013 [Scheffersomyces spartinae]|uniref:Uncharacterized protein n=1 Tax=Scheffersomyces spartinae TaxID=45513 RepID=A0A9P8AKK2_9ASCO|nr:uncharacterized protein KQ657_000013 [Scheffersomyces spartinae]KAG7196007.1 hypothetical protein KQ657_000013 [Scheffersomyces spartinae]
MSRAVLALLLLVINITIAAPIKRDVVYVIATTTVDMQYSQFAALQPTSQIIPTLPVTPTPVVTPSPAATPNIPATSVAESTKGGSFWQQLQQLLGFGESDSSSSAVATPTPVAPNTNAPATVANGRTNGQGHLATVIDTQVVYVTATLSSSAATLLPAVSTGGPSTSVSISVSGPSTSVSISVSGPSTSVSISVSGPSTSVSISVSGSPTSVPISLSAPVISQPAPGGATASSTVETGTSTSTGGSSNGNNNNSSSSSSGGIISIDAAQKVAQEAKGISYSPYTNSGSCKSLSDVTHDFQILQHYSEIRLYSTDCSAIENLLLLMTSGQSLFLGIYNIDTHTITTGLQTIKTAVEGSSLGWNAVNTISIGNERVNNGWSTPADMQTAVNTAKSWLKSNAPNYTGPVVTVDTLVATVNNPQLCQVSDYIAVNCHPFWDGGVEPSNAGPWLQEQILHLRSVCGSSKRILITETGWPTKGDTFGICVPSQENQNLAISSINSVLANDVYMFTTYNDFWKQPGPSNVEQYWGIYGNPAT